MSFLNTFSVEPTFDLNHHYYSNVHFFYSLVSTTQHSTIASPSPLLSPANSSIPCNQSCCAQYPVVNEIGPQKQNYHPVFPYVCEDNVLQDDTMSVITASDVHYNSPATVSQPSPSLLSVIPSQHNDFNAHYTTHSPPLSELNTNHYDTKPFAGQEVMGSLFAPVYSPKPTDRDDSDVTKKRHVCPVCNHRSKRRHNLIEHMLTHDPNRPKSFKCSMCARPFARKYDMKRHEKIHRR